MVRWAVVGSGSSGNSYVFSDGQTSILIDQGFSVAELKRRLDSLNIPIESVTSLYLTHLHPDHARGVGGLARKHRVSVHLHHDAMKGEHEAFSALKIPQELVVGTTAGQEHRSGPFTVHCFETSHDSAGSVGWMIRYKDQQFMVLTDTGETTSEQRSLAKDATVLFLEANYDELMLKQGPYPPFLKERISSNRGHLSNAQAFAFLEESDFDGSHVYFIHISDVNNDITLLADEARVRCSTPFTVCAKGELYGVLR